MSDLEIRLDNQLCFALYAATNAITRLYRGPLAELGLTYPQYLVIITLLEQESMTSGELARRLKLDAGTLTPMLKRLAAAGLVERKRRPEDERVIDNRLSPRGRRLHDELTDVHSAILCRTHLSDEEVVALRNALHVLTATLGTDTPELPAVAEMIAVAD